ncbi:MAG: UbiA family prenyltransferase [Candidatus Marsarchaeota archaeon]|nr:UbiA family prenyltransferase [Candidatus Marsarchaeota archaeon]
MERFFAKILPKHKAAGLIELGRPWNGIGSSLIMLAGAFLAAPAFPSTWTLLGITAVALFTYMAGGTLNDIFDVEIDKLNMPYRVSKQKGISRKEAFIFAIILFSLSSLISILLSVKFWIIILVYTVFTIAYSWPPISFVKRGYLAQLELAFTAVLLSGYAGAVLVLNTYQVPLLTLFAFGSLTLLFSFIFIIKDFKDVKGDKVGGKRTLALRIGVKNAKAVSVLGTLIFLPLTALLFNTFFNSPFFLVLSTLMFLALLYSEYMADKKPEEMFTLVRLTLLVFYLLTLYLSISRFV